MTYAVRWVDPSTGRMRCEGCGTDRHLAKRMIERKKAELRAGILGDATRAKYDDFVAMVLKKLAQKERAPATIHAVERVLERFKMICDPSDVGLITTQMIDRYDWKRRQGARRCWARNCCWSNLADASVCWKCGHPLTDLVRPLSVVTRITDLKLLKASLARARKEYRLPINPFAEYEWPTVDEKLPRALELSEVLKIMAVADEQWTVFIYVAIVTGMRTGELIGLNWSGTDLERGVCTLRSTKGRRDRLAYLDDHAVQLLRKHLGKRRFVGPVDAPVFIRTDEYALPGARWTAAFLVRMWHRLREKAGVAHCCPKDLRKTSATNLAEANINQRIAREVTGHATSAVLEQYYQRARTEAVRAAVTKAAEPLRRALGAG